MHFPIHANVRDNDHTGLELIPQILSKLIEEMASNHFPLKKYKLRLKINTMKYLPTVITQYNHPKIKMFLSMNFQTETL